MTRRLDERDRVLNELIDRLGSEDPLVAEWSKEREILESSELSAPGKLHPTRRVGTRIASGWSYGNRFTPSTRDLRTGSRSSAAGYY
jgi:hypothetical protein